MVEQVNEHLFMLIEVLEGGGTSERGRVDVGESVGTTGDVGRFGGYIHVQGISNDAHCGGKSCQHGSGR